MRHNRFAAPDGRKGAWRLLRRLMVCAVLLGLYPAVGAEHGLVPPAAPPEVPRVVAQIPWFAQRQPQEPRRTPAARREEQTPDSGEFIWAKDLADRMKQIDPNAVVEWDGRVLRVEASGQKFSMFPRSNQVVVNGNVERVAKPLRIANDEIYVPVEAVELIGRRLEEALAAAPTPTPSVAETTATPTVAEAAPTPSPTPAPVASETPQATPTVVATATPEPPPAPTPTPESVSVTDSRPSPSPRAGRATPRPAVTPDPGDGASLYQALLRERSEMASFRIAKFTETELQGLAGVTALKKVVLDPDDGPDPAAGSLGREASELSLELARKVEARLKMRGVETQLTRTGPQRVSLGRKLEIVTNSGAQALVSLRVGISGFTDASGARVFYTSDSVDYRTGRPAVRDASGTVAAEANYLLFQDRSKALALALLEAVKRGAPREGTADASPAPLWLARRAPMASAMVMVGYVTNSLDALILRDPQRQDALADALAEAIVTFGAALEAPAPAPTRRPGVASVP